MVFGLRRKRKVNKHREEDTKMELTIPNNFLCPISLDLMKDPVTLSSGITYDRESIESWLENGNFTCPVTNQTLTSFDQIPNHSLRKLIQHWCVENGNSGVQRIPTPRIPISSVEVNDLLENLDSFAKVLDKSKCISLLKKMKKWSSESERNLRLIISHRSGAVLASVFCEFSSDSIEKNSDILGELLTLMGEIKFPLDMETQFYLGSRSSLTSMVWFLKCGDFSSKHNSIILLKRLLDSDSDSDSNSKQAKSLAEIEGINKVLFNLIKDPISPTITKSSLMVIFHLLSLTFTSRETIKSEFVHLGLIPLLLEMIVDSERNICERALGVFDKLCDSEKGREEAYNNALTWPVLVKKILRVSSLATDFSVSGIWKLNKYGRKEELVICEALQVGAFQKLVLLLQVGCSEETKEKATELLKVMNPYRNGLECIDSVDFKNLKRSF